MEYSNIIIAFVSIISVVITMSKILDKKFDKIDESFKEVRKDIQNIRVELKEDIHELRVELKEDIHELRVELKEDIHKVDSRIARIEGKLEIPNKIVYVQHEDLKEN